MNLLTNIEHSDGGGLLAEAQAGGRIMGLWGESESCFGHIDMCFQRRCTSIFRNVTLENWERERENLKHRVMDYQQISRQ